MARCTQCNFYMTAEETGDEPGCAAGGDVSNPDEDIYCGEVEEDDDEETT